MVGLTVLPMPGTETPMGCHTLRATGITDYLTNGGPYRGHAAQWPEASNAKTTGPLRLHNDDISLGGSGEIAI